MSCYPGPSVSDILCSFVACAGSVLCAFCAWRSVEGSDSSWILWWVLCFSLMRECYKHGDYPADNEVE